MKYSPFRAGYFVLVGWCAFDAVAFGEVTATKLFAGVLVSAGVAALVARSQRKVGEA